MDAAVAVAVAVAVAAFVGLVSLAASDGSGRRLSVVHSRRWRGPPVPPFGYSYEVLGRLFFWSLFLVVFLALPLSLGSMELCGCGPNPIGDG